MAVTAYCLKVAKWTKAIGIFLERYGTKEFKKSAYLTKEAQNFMVQDSVVYTDYTTMLHSKERQWLLCTHSGKARGIHLLVSHSSSKYIDVILP